MVAPGPVRMRLLSALVLVQVVMPTVLSVRPALRSCTAVPLMARAPLVVVVPVPDMPPADQVARPVISTLPVPPSVPPDCR